MEEQEYIGAYAFKPNEDMIVTIKSWTRKDVIGEDGKKKEHTVLFFQENVKPLVLNRTNGKTIQKIYDTPNIEEWVGKKIQLYATKVKAFGEMKEAVRIREFIPKVQEKEKIEYCADCKNPIKAYGTKSAIQLAQYTFKNYGRKLCAECAAKAAQSKSTIENNEKKEEAETEVKSE
jgi:hypothetical protein